MSEWQQIENLAALRRVEHQTRLALLRAENQVLKAIARHGSLTGNG